MQRPFAAYQGDEPYIFVSYAHDDASFVYEIMVGLRERGFNIWYDEGISPGSTWRDEVALALAQCSLFLFFVSPRSVASENCSQELNFCLSRERKVLAVHLEQTPMPPGMELSLSDKQAIIKGHRSENAFYAKLDQGINALMSTAKATNPLPGIAKLGVDRAPEKSIAVLPLTNRSNDPNNDYLAEGISEELISGLSNVDGLRVASEISSFAYKDHPFDLSTLGAELNVQTILSGSVQKSGTRVRINVLLNDVAAGSSLWSQRYDRELEDIFELQDDVARQVIDALKIELGAAPSTKLIDTGTDNAAAYNELLLARFQASKESIREAYRGIEHCRESIRLDPGYVAPHALITHLYLWLQHRDAEKADEHLENARHFQGLLEALDPGRSQPMRFALDQQLSAELEGNEQAHVHRESFCSNIIRHAEQYHPNYVSGAYREYLTCFRNAGLYRALLEFAEAPVVADEPWVVYLRGEAFAALGQFDKAIVCCGDAIAREPQGIAPRTGRAIWLSRTGQYEAAQRDLDVLNASWGPRHFPAFTHDFWMGKLNRARDCSQWLATRRNFPCYYKGAASVMLSDVETGLDYFAQGIEREEPTSATYLKSLNDAFLPDSQRLELSSHPRYQAQLHMIGADESWQGELLRRTNELTPFTQVRVHAD